MKAWFTSKIVWLGILTTALGVIPLVVDFVNALTTASQLNPSVVAVALGTMLTGILTVIMRVWFTSEPIKAKVK